MLQSFDKSGISDDVKADLQNVIITSTNGGLKEWNSMWTLRKRLKQLLPDADYTAKALRRASESKFVVSSDVDKFLEALVKMKLKAEFQPEYVDIHVRNLPWGWTVADINDMLVDKLPGATNIDVFSKRKSRQDVEVDREWILHMGSGRFQVPKETWKSAFYDEWRDSFAQQTSYEFDDADVGRVLYFSPWKTKPVKYNPKNKISSSPVKQSSHRNNKAYGSVAKNPSSAANTSNFADIITTQQKMIDVRILDAQKREFLR